MAGNLGIEGGTKWTRNRYAQEGSPRIIAGYVSAIEGNGPYEPYFLTGQGDLLLVPQNELLDSQSNDLSEYKVGTGVLEGDQYTGYTVRLTSVDQERLNVLKARNLAQEKGQTF